ncbi:MAG TPA: hypothetical protein VGR24_00965 [bacterium]|jgi:hypothetical protein|nr:hypothetical protein [bacterium]
MGRRRKRVPWYGRAWLWAGVLAVVVLVGAAVLWPRSPAYAQYTDGVRPTVVFVWSDPTPHHPYG